MAKIVRHSLLVSVPKGIMIDLETTGKSEDEDEILTLGYVDRNEMIVVQRAQTIGSISYDKTPDKAKTGREISGRGPWRRVIFILTGVALRTASVSMTKGPPQVWLSLHASGKRLLKRYKGILRFHL